MDGNVKNLIKVLIVGGIVILTIIVMFIIKNYFALDKYQYEIPTTLKVNDQGYKEAESLNDKRKKELNDYLYNNEFLTAMNNVIDGTYANKNVDYLQDEDNLFIFSYVILSKKQDIINAENINLTLKKYFNKNISENTIKAYESDGDILYNIKYPMPSYCFKANKIVEGDNGYKLYVDVIDYSMTDCQPDIIDYDESKVLAFGVFSFVQNDEMELPNSFILID